MESLEGMPPGLDPSVAAKPKTTKSAKRNERKKEKRLQVYTAHKLVLRIVQFLIL